MSEYSLVMKFVDGSDSFANGFECGLIWASLLNKTQYSFTCHRSNIDQIKEIAKHFKYQLSIDNCFDDDSDENFESINNEWCSVEFNKTYLKLIK